MPIADIATLTGLDLGPLVAADRFPSAVRAPAEVLTSATAASSGRWRQLHDLADIRL